MNCTRSLTITAFTTTKQSAAHHLLKIFSSNGATVTTHLARPTLLGLHQNATFNLTTTRPLTTTPPTLKGKGKEKEESFPQPTTPSIRLTPPAWPHPGFTHPTMEAVTISHRPPRDIPDRIAFLTVKLLRFGLDFVTGYSPSRAPTARQFMIRNIFLESVAGVPGMVAGMLRHMHSLRRLKRDGGWMETLLEESYNERMHLLTFLKLAEPGWFMRLAVLATQGVFFNAFLAAYLVAPKVCHRFVGYLEEEAVKTYTAQIHHLSQGHLPEWSSLQAPDIAVQYWKMPEGQRSMRDLLLYIRADESKHREVNHTLGNLDQREDPNPYVSVYRDGEGKEEKPRPGKGLDVDRGMGWEREEVL